jgi:hypothetical protein
VGGGTSRRLETEPLNQTLVGTSNLDRGVMIRFSPHFPFLHYVTWPLTCCPNCSWLTVRYMTWLSDTNHLSRTSMPNPYLTLMTQTRSPCLLISTSAFRHTTDPWPSATYPTPIYLPCTVDYTLFLSSLR